MAKVKTFFLSEAGTMPNGKGNVTCKEWNTIAEEIIQKKKRWPESESASKSKAPKPLKINEIDSTQEVRMDTTDSELNRVLEAVLFRSLILLGGEPGIGKARLLQIS
jgi:DNA repair protein RadA/Sms